MLSKRYYWRDLVNGLLLNLEDCGPYYNKRNLNSAFGFITEEEAVKTLEEFLSAGEVYFQGDAVLITVFEKI